MWQASSIFAQCFREFVALVGGQVPLLHHGPQAIDLVDFPPLLARGVLGWFVVPLEQSVTPMSPEAMQVRQALPNSYIAAVFA
jgi:hypothetical protein